MGDNQDDTWYKAMSVSPSAMQYLANAQAMKSLCKSTCDIYTSDIYTIFMCVLSYQFSIVQDNANKLLFLYKLKKKHNNFAIT